LYAPLFFPVVGALVSDVVFAFKGVVVGSAALSVGDESVVTGSVVGSIVGPSLSFSS
jgi:hypothetical protein